MKQTLVILDAHAIIHRAYHALPSFTNSAGAPTGALYGLASMLLRIIEELKPTAIVAAYDLPKPTFRHHAYEGYKGTRAKTDDDLVSQIIQSRTLFSAFNIVQLDAEGFEADDVVGTLVEQHKHTKDLTIIIASGDMDTLQLVEGDTVKVFTLKKGVNDTILYDEKAVHERFGFTPKQLVDYKGLRGDPSDNIIGVPGIGEKTATTIITEFGSIERLYEVLESNKDIVVPGLTPRIIALLRDHKDDAFFSKTLATIRRDAPVSYTIPSEPYLKTINEQALRDIFAEYEFGSLIPRVKKVFQFAPDTPTEVVDQTLLREASIALWVLYSEQTSPTYEMILERTRKKTLTESFDAIVAELDKQGLRSIYENIEKPIIPIVASMQQWGIMIDRSHFELLRETFIKKLKEIEEQVLAETGVSINLNSPKQLSELLFNTLGLTPKGKRKASGSFTTNAETLEELRDEHVVVGLILEHREIQKLLGTYVEAMLEHAGDDSRIHATFLQHGTTTGRFSSANPNLQTIPMKESGRDIRHGFIASPGHVFIGCDYAQIELRVLAILCGDQALKDSFIRGDDIHKTVASFMFKVPPEDVTTEMRRKAKVINFGILYGMGVSALQKNLMTTRAEAQAFYTQYFESFPTIAHFLESTKNFAKEHGYTETLFKRRRYFPGINAGAPFLRALAERMAVNAPIQGSNADIIKIAIKLIDTDLRNALLIDKVHLVLQVHDELVYEVDQSVQKEAEQIIVSAMQSVFARSPIPVSDGGVPLVVSTGVGVRLDELK